MSDFWSDVSQVRDKKLRRILGKKTEKFTEECLIKTHGSKNTGVKNWWKSHFNIKDKSSTRGKRTRGLIGCR